jgi:hypothetical protein
MAEIVTVEQCLQTIEHALQALAPEQVTAFWNAKLNSLSPAIEASHRQILHAALAKLAACAKVNARLGDLYEPQTRTKLNVSCEMVGFNEDMQVYLVQRPSKEEKPDEPYPLKWHTLGTGIEPFGDSGNVIQWEDVFVTVARKFGKNVVLKNIQHVPPIGYPHIAHDLPRGPYQLDIFRADIVGQPDNPRGAWFGLKEALQLDLVDSHRKIILPAFSR